MSVFHFYDTSALLKNYVDEKGSIWLRQQLCAIDALHVIGSLTRVEVFASFARARKAKYCSAEVLDKAINAFKQDLTAVIGVLANNDDLIEKAIQLTQKYALRGYDAIQLANALALKRRLNADHATPTHELIFFCADIELLSAAKAEGLAVANPNDYD